MINENPTVAGRWHSRHGPQTRPNNPQRRPVKPCPVERFRLGVDGPGRDVCSAPCASSHVVRTSREGAVRNGWRVPVVAQAWSAVDGGHGNLPGGGHRKSPLMATRSPHGQPSGERHAYGVIERHGPWLSPRCRPVVGDNQPAASHQPVRLAPVTAGAGNVRRGSSRRPPGESDP